MLKKKSGLKRINFAKKFRFLFATRSGEPLLISLASPSLSIHVLPLPLPQSPPPCLHIPLPSTLARHSSLLHTPNHRGREVHLALISSLDVRSDAGIDLWHVFQGAAHCYVARRCYSYATFGSRMYIFACIYPSAWFADAGLHHGPSP